MHSFFNFFPLGFILHSVLGIWDDLKILWDNGCILDQEPLLWKIIVPTRIKLSCVRKTGPASFQISPECWGLTSVFLCFGFLSFKVGMNKNGISLFTIMMSGALDECSVSAWGLEFPQGRLTRRPHEKQAELQECQLRTVSVRCVNLGSTWELRRSCSRWTPDDPGQALGSAPRAAPHHPALLPN